MRIVLDSSVICSDYQLAGITFRVLFAGLASGEHSLHVPATVLDEVTAGYERELRAVTEKIAKAGVDYHRVTGGWFMRPVTRLDIHQLVPKYGVDLRQKLGAAGAAILPYPEVAHESLLKRALSRKKPFADSGAGYGDSLIWETVLRLAETEGQPVAFISKNVRDFAGDASLLHPDLTADLSRRGIAPERVTLFPSLEAFVERCIKPLLESVSEDAIRWQLQAGVYAGRDLAEQIASDLPSSARGGEWEPSYLGFPSEFEGVSVSSVDDIHDFSVADIRRLSKIEFLVTMQAKASVEFSFFIPKADYAMMSDQQTKDIFVWDHEWTDWSVAASATREVRLGLQLTVDAKAGRITSLELEDLDVLGGEYSVGEYSE
jgi:hypothetical protein